MLEESKSDIVFFPKETTYKIGKITYIVASHFDENAEPLVAKIKNLLKADIQTSGSLTGVSGTRMV